MTARKELETFGRKRRRGYVRVVEEFRGRERVIRVLWSEADGRHAESYPATKAGRRAAVAWAEGLHERLLADPRLRTTTRPLTLRELWERYVDAEFDALRATTRENYRARWRKVELILNPNTPAESLTRESVDLVKKALLAGGHVWNQMSRHVDLLKWVLNFGVERELIAPSRVTSYRLKRPRDLKDLDMGEYRRPDAARILAQWSPRHPRQWRPWVLTTLLHYCGPRQRSALALEWPDVDFGAGMILWRSETDKLGREREQPMPEPVREALWVAYGWRIYEGYPGRYVFFGVQRRTRGTALRPTSRGHGRRAWDLHAGIVVDEKPWTYSAYNARLHAAERASGIAPQKYRAAHGFRRGVFGDVLEDTDGNYKRAADWIGDEDIRIGRRHYDKKRVEQLRATAAQLAGGGAPGPDADPKTESQTRPNATGVRVGAPEGESNE